METDREGNAEEARELDYKAMVLNLYPDAAENVIRDGEWIVYEVYTQFDSDDAFCYAACSYTLSFAWQRVWEKIEERMLRKLAE